MPASSRIWRLSRTNSTASSRASLPVPGGGRFARFGARARSDTRFAAQPRVGGERSDAVATAGDREIAGERPVRARSERRIRRRPRGGRSARGDRDTRLGAGAEARGAAAARDLDPLHFRSGIVEDRTAPRSARSAARRRGGQHARPSSRDRRGAVGAEPAEASDPDAGVCSSLLRRWRSVVVVARVDHGREREGSSDDSRARQLHDECQPRTDRQPGPTAARSERRETATARPSDWILHGTPPRRAGRVPRLGSLLAQGSGVGIEPSPGSAPEWHLRSDSPITVAGPRPTFTAFPLRSANADTEYAHRYHPPRASVNRAVSLTPRRAASRNRHTRVAEGVGKPV